MGALPLSVTEIETPKTVDENAAPKGRIYLIASSGGARVPAEIEETVASAIPGPSDAAAADLYYRDCHLMTVPDPAKRGGAIKLAVPFAGGSLDHGQFRLVTREDRNDVQGMVVIQRPPQTRLERQVDKQARDFDEKQKMEPYAAYPLVVAGVVAGVALVVYFLYRAVKAVQRLANRGSADNRIEAVFGEDARAAIRQLDPQMSAAELVAARRSLLRGHASGS